MENPIQQQTAQMNRGVLELTICFWPNVGGVETHLSDLVKELAARGTRVYVLSYCPLTTQAPWKRRETIGNIEIWRLWWFGQGWFHILEHYPLLQFLYLVPRLLISAFIWLVRYGRHVQAIHAHGLAAAFCARLLAPVFRKRTVVSSHAIYESFQAGSRVGSAVRWILSGIDYTITLSDQSRRQLIGLGLPESKVGRYRYWIDLSVFCPGDRTEGRRALKLAKTDFVCLFVGRLIPLKGVRVLLECAARPELAAVKFAFAGVGPLQQELQDAAKKQANVIYAGNVRNEALAAYYRTADVLCVPSQNEEGFGRVILESLACGTPVIGADCPGIREATVPEVAWLIKPDVATVSGLLNEILNAPQRLQEKKSSARHFAERQYSTQNIKAIEDALFKNDAASGFCVGTPHM